MAGSFGELLKRERELREICLDEITLATRIAPRFLQALENEDWEKLPGGVFNRGFVRAIARYLGLDEERFLSEYDLAHAGPAPLPVRENRIPSAHRLLTLVIGLAILGGVAAAALFGLHTWRRYSEDRTQRQSTGLVPARAHAQPPAALPNLLTDSAASASPLDLAVSTSAPTRIRIVADGKVLLDAALSAGETRHFSAGQQFEVTAADSSAVLLELNGRAMPAVGAPGASGTIMLSQKNLRASSFGNSQP
jgi:cytoskeletal protein RodZ